MGARFRLIVSNGSTWAIVCSALVIGSTFLPWDYVPLWGLRFPLSGFNSWCGKTVAGIALAFGLLLVATYTSGRPPLWKPVATGLAGAALLAFGVWYQNGGEARQGTETTTSSMGESTKVTKRQVTVSPGEGIYVVQGAAVAFLLIATFQYRESRRTIEQPPSNESLEATGPV